MRFWSLVIGRLVIIWLLVIGHWSLLVAPVNAQESPKPVWPTYGLEINNTLGNSPQQNPKIVNNIIVWEDGRHGYTNLYAQKIDESGNRLWNKDGIAVARVDGNQNNFQLVNDGAGGAIIVWQDYRSGNSDIYAQRLGDRGELLWGEAGIPICKAAAGQFAPDLASDGAGGVIIVWHDYRSGTGEDIYAQRIDRNGKNLWNEDGIPICEAAGTQWYPKIASDGVGGAIIIWTDGRISSADNNIYGQRVDAAGKVLWEKDGISICSAPQNQEHPAILGTDGQAIVAWNDSRSGNIDIYLQKIDGGGKPLWEKDGVPAVVAPFSQENPKLASDGAGGAIVVWTDNRAEESAIFAQRITREGKINWGENGRAIARAATKQENPEIVKLKTMDWVVVWEDFHRGFPLLFAQKINSAGTALWQEGGISLSSGQNAQEKASLVSSPNDEIMVTWQDRRQGNYDIFAQKLSAAGMLAWGADGNKICDALGLVIHQNASLIDNIVVFEDARSGYFNIYAQKIGKDGTLLWGKDGVPLAKVKANQANPQLVSDGAGGAIVVWEDLRHPNFPKIYAQRISAAGKKVWEKGSVPLSKINSRQSYPLVVSDGAGGAIVVWQDERNPLSLKDLYGQRISAKGELLWDKNGIALCLENGEQTEAAMVSDGAGGAIITWTDYRNGERNPDIYAQRINGGGKLLWKKEGILVCSAPDIQRTPQIIQDENGDTIISWTDKGGGSYDIYAQRLNPEGQAQWLTDGIPINQLGRTQQNPHLGNSQIIVWEDYRLGNWDIFAGAVSPQGKLLWNEEGIPVVTLPFTQYAPRTAPWKNNEVIITWEDYRSGKQYEIYLQKINAAGKISWPQNGVQVKSLNGARAPKLSALPDESSLVVVWEDYSGGGHAIYGQRFIVD